MRRATVALVLCATATATAACGRGAAVTPSDPVEATQARLAEVRRASLDMELRATAGSTGTTATAVQIKGPFQAPSRDRELPVARLESARLIGTQRTTTTFISTGTRAWVDAGGAVTEIQGAQLDALRATTKKDADQLGGLHLTRWFGERRASTAAGVTTVTGTLDAPSAINDVFGLAGAFGAGENRRTLTGKDAERVRELVSTSRVELVTGADDHVLRSLRFDVTFAPQGDAEIRRLLPDVSSAGLHFSLRLADVGKPVRVAAP
jgi:hypothetical protein